MAKWFLHQTAKTLQPLSLLVVWKWCKWGVWFISSWSDVSVFPSDWVFDEISQAHSLALSFPQRWVLVGVFLFLPRLLLEAPTSLVPPSHSPWANVYLSPSRPHEQTSAMSCIVHSFLSSIPQGTSPLFPEHMSLCASSPHLRFSQFLFISSIFLHYWFWLSLLTLPTCFVSVGLCLFSRFNFKRETQRGRESLFTERG